MQTSTHYLICLLKFISPFLTSIYRCDQYTIMKTKILQFFPHRFILLVVFIPSLCLGLETDTISRGLVMKDPDTIVSSRNMFKLGFFSPENTTNRYLAIFFAFSEQTAIWIANRDKPLTDSSGAVTISRDGNLVLINGRNQTVWSTNAAASTNTSLQILDTGNLLLRNLATEDTIWDSFSNLTDVLLPGMTLTYNTHSGRQAILSSWKNATDPATGSFTAGIESVNTLQLVIRNEGRLHWRSGPWNGMLFIGIKEMFYSYLDGFNQLRNDSAGNFYYMLPDSNYLVKVSLNSSGNSLRMHWNDQTKRWDTVWVAPGNRCDVYGMCGPFGSCSVEDSPICSCLRGFEPINRDEWERGNWSSGCQRKRQLKCDADDEDKFLRLQFMKVPNFGETFYSRVEDECRSRCLGNCSCVAYVHDTSLGCILWHEDLIDIQKFSGVGIDLFLRLSASEFGSHKDRKMYIIIPVVVTFVCLLLLVFAAWCWTAKRKGQKVKDRDILQVGQMLSSDSTAIVLKDESEKVNIGELPSFTFDMLAEATDQFHENNLLGRGGFGPVYKGNLGNGKVIAVKRLSADSGQGVEEFMNEVIVISKLQHRNLVRLLGGCVEKEEKMLVYEYMPNKSLDVCLFDVKEGPSKQVLEWAKRISIIEGIGRGLLYLHKDSRLRIIHRDLKPSNVLLDKDWNPKISDFGMARIFGGNQDHGDTARVVGTYGYMAPEYAMEGRFSEKSDVYSFGVLILEIVKGRKNTSYYNREWCLSLVGYAWKLWSEGNGCGFVDESIGSSGLEEEMVRCVQIGLLCVQEFPKDRPTVQTILAMLTREIVELPMPEQPIFADKNWNASASGSTHPGNRVGLSINELTLTELHPR